MSHLFTKRQLSQIMETVDVESPILKNLLGKRILEAWGIARMGGRLQKRFDELLQMAEVSKTLEPNGEECFWKKEQDPEDYLEYRVLGENDYKRSIEEIPFKELTNGLTSILRQMISLPQEDLIREGAREFGFARVGNQVRDKLAQAILLMVDQKLAKEEEGRIKLRGI